MKKIIALSCSPSRGRNSDTMLDNFIKGVEEVQGVEIEKIYLGDIYIENYKFENSTGAQPDEKDFAELTKRIQNEVDGLVIATPTYNFSVPAYLKNFIDRIRFFALDFTKKNFLGQPVGMMRNIKMYFVVSGGTPNWARRILFLLFPPFWLRVIFSYFGAKNYGSIYSGDVKSFDNEEILERCRKAGRKYAEKVARS